VVAALTVVLAVVNSACAKPRGEPLRLEGKILTAQNQSDSDWTNVEIWINRQFRMTTPTLAAGQVFRAPLEYFVTGYGQKFRFNQIQITDIRMNAKQADGKPIEIRMKFSGDSLSDALKGMGGSH